MRIHGGKRGQGSSYILGVAKLTMNCGFGGFCGFWRSFCETEAPRGQTRGGGCRRRRVGAGARDCRPLFPQCQRHRCVNNNGHVQSMTDCIIIVLCVCGWCSKVNTTGNELLGSRYSPLDMHSVLYMTQGVGVEGQRRNARHL